MTKIDNLKAYLSDSSSKPLILDGGLGAQLEDTGYDDDMNDVLWSTIALFKYPEVVADIHKNFLKSGADIITTNTYQASEKGLIENQERLGLKTSKDIEDVFSKAITVAESARSEFWADYEKNSKKPNTRIYPLIGGSVGPFGAYVGDRSEYTGYYPSIETNFDQSIREFHRLRLQILLDSTNVDFIMLETIPNFQELKLLIDLIHELKPRALYTISLSLKSFDKLADGTELTEIMAYIGSLSEDKVDQILAIGTNCSPLLFSDATLSLLSKHNTKGLQLIVYPNSGEVYDKSTRTHSPDPLLQDYACEHGLNPDNFHDILQYITQKWISQGAKLVGGCCRITPEHIKWIHDAALK